MYCAVGTDASPQRRRRHCSCGAAAAAGFDVPLAAVCVVLCQAEGELFLQSVQCQGLRHCCFCAAGGGGGGGGG